LEEAELVAGVGVV